MSRGLFEKPVRPEVGLKMSRFEWLLEIVALAGIAANLALLACFWPQMPETTATTTTPGMSRTGIFMFVTLLPVVACLGATLLGRFPKWFNYPVEITKENAAREYRLAADMLRVVKAEVVLGMLYVEWAFIQVALGNSASLTLEYLVVFLILLVATALYFIYQMIKQK